MQFAYVNKKTLTEARSPPWSLGTGDVAKNLETLGEQKAVVGNVTLEHILCLVQMGVNKQVLVDTCKLFQETPWFANLVEKAHGSMAVVHRQHQFFEALMLTSRTTIHQLRPLFSDTLDMRQLQRSEDKLAKECRKTGVITGRHVFFQEMMAHHRKHAAPADLALGNAEIMNKHTMLYTNLPASKIKEYEQKARVKTFENIAEIKKNKKFFEDQIGLVEVRKQAAIRLIGRRNDMSECMLSDKAVTAICKDMQDSSLPVNELQKSRMSSIAQPLLPLTSEQQEFAKHFEEPADHTDLASWLKLVCKRRAVFKDCAFIMPDGSAYLFIYATQNPLEVSLLALQDDGAVAPPLSDVQGVDLFLSQSCIVWAHQFKYKIGDTVDGHALQECDPEGRNVKVVQGVCLMGGWKAVSDSPAMAFMDFADSLPESDLPVTGKPKKATPHATISKDLLSKHPWLAEYQTVEL